MSQDPDTPLPGLTLGEFVLDAIERYRVHAQTMSHAEARDLAYMQALKEKLLPYRGKFTGLLSGIERDEIRWQPQKEGAQ
jgi:hypothetical protein